jgi:hypothetical protein
MPSSWRDPRRRTEIVSTYFFLPRMMSKAPATRVMAETAVAASISGTTKLPAIAALDKLAINNAVPMSFLIPSSDPALRFRGLLLSAPDDEQGAGQ